jgi:hypothetical protein
MHKNKRLIFCDVHKAVHAQQYVIVHTIMHCTHSTVHTQKYVTVHNILPCTHSTVHTQNM